MTAAAMPTISIVVPALNAAASIGDMLAGLASQAGLHEVPEIIVVDGRSSDDTVAICERHGARVLVEPKRGPGAGRNCGLHAAGGDIICHLDADTLPTRRWVAEMVAPFADPSVMLVGGKSLSFPAKTGAQRYMAVCGRIDSHEYMNRPLFPFVPSRNMAVRREVALEVGGWADECITGEDVDFCHRILHRYPSSMVYVEKAVLFHHDRESDVALAKQAFSYGEGTAHLYMRYPDEVSWGLNDVAAVASVLVRRACKATGLSLAAACRALPGAQAEIARYDWLWTRSFWRGFYSYRRTRAYR